MTSHCFWWEVRCWPYWYSLVYEKSFLSCCVNTASFSLTLAFFLCVNVDFFLLIVLELTDLQYVDCLSSYLVNFQVLFTLFIYLFWFFPFGTTIACMLNTLWVSYYSHITSYFFSLSLRFHNLYWFMFRFTDWFFFWHLILLLTSYENSDYLYFSFRISICFFL